MTYFLGKLPPPLKQLERLKVRKADLKALLKEVNSRRMAHANRNE